MRVGVQPIAIVVAKGAARSPRAATEGDDMKSRRVMVALELETDVAMVDLRDMVVWQTAIDDDIDEPLATMPDATVLFGGIDE